MRKRRNKRSMKRGLSAVVTTLVIILLVLFTSGVIWTVIQNVISEQAREISLGKFSTDLNIKSVKVEGEILSVGVERNPGKGDIIKLKFVFENTTSSEIVERESDIGELEEQNFIFSLGDLSLLGIKKVSIVPIYESSSGEEVSGDVIDIFELEKPIRGEVGTWEYLGNFEKLGFKGAGKKEYSISSQSEDVVKFKKAIVDPLDVLPGDNQTFTAYVYSPYNITEVTTTTELDESILNLDLEEIGKDENGNQIFLATWIVNDVHTTTYRTTFTARDSEGNSNSIILTWTDSCQSQITHGGDDTLSTSCSTGASAIAGIDGGSLTISSGVVLTLDSGSQFIFNQGKSITITAAGASIAATTSGSFGNGNLYHTDADGDGYAPNNNVFLSGGVRAMSASGTSDCMDTGGGAVNVYTTSVVTGSDNDQDGYTDTTGDNNCRGDSTSVGGRTYYKDTAGAYSWLTDGQKLGANDCNDGSASVWSQGYGTDADGDGYGVDISIGCNNGAASGSDCQDTGSGAVNVWFQATGTNIDSDQDGYEVGDPGSSVSRCIGAMTTISGRRYYNSPDNTYDFQVWSDRLGSNDCLDSASSVNPGVTAWYTSSGPNGWDYNCVGGDEKRWTTTGGGCDQCIWTIEEECLDQVPGSAGWEGSLPGCGVSGTYHSSGGLSCAARGEPDCESTSVPPCAWITRTQECH
jgi:hypothetical protein